MINPNMVQFGQMKLFLQIAARTAFTYKKEFGKGSYNVRDKN